ncbi:MAG: CoA-binding protein [Chloroflexi bacterium]|nr:CoA-binding protein [Chloroflexota bacterium]
MASHALEPLLRPRSIAVLGASPRPGSLGNTTVQNLLSFGYSGPIYPIHPTAAKVAGLRCYPSLAHLPATPQCAVVALSADRVQSALAEAAEHSIRAAVVFASGYAETGSEGRARQAALRDLCEGSGIKVCGPNCLGLVNVTDRVSLYSAPLPECTRPGGLAVVSQSGSGCIVLNNTGRFGMSYLISSGNEVNVGLADYLDFFAQDGSTRVVACFVEEIRDPLAFADAAARLRLAGKPLVVLKVGRSAKGAESTAAHTGSLAGSESVYADFFRRNAIIAVDDLDELVESAALMLATRTLPSGNGLAVINVSGGESALTCDLAERLGVRLASLADETIARLRAVLPAFGRPSNPLDATAVAVFDMALYRNCLETLDSDPSVALVAVSQDCPSNLGSHQAATYRAIAEMVAATAPHLAKPVVFYSNVAAGVHSGVAAPLEDAGLPVLQGARASLLAVRRLFEYSAQMRHTGAGEVAPGLAPDSIWHARLESGRPLTEHEAKQFLHACGILATREELASSRDEAVATSERIGFPVALKVSSADVAHKSESWSAAAVSSSRWSGTRL